IEVDPQDALARQRSGAILIDVRDENERGAGTAAAAIGITRERLAERIESIVAERDREILTLCASGRRSLLARETLLDLGFTKVSSVRGGFQRWRAEQLPLAEGGLDNDSAER